MLLKIYVSFVIVYVAAGFSICSFVVVIALGLDKQGFVSQKYVRLWCCVHCMLYCVYSATHADVCMHKRAHTNTQCTFYIRKYLISENFDGRKS